MNLTFLSLIFLFTTGFSASGQNFQGTGKLASNYNSKAVAYTVDGLYDSAIICYKKAAALYLKKTDTLAAIANQINMGKVYRDIAQYEKGLEELYNAASILETCCHTGLNRIFYLSSCYTTIASIHRAISNYTKAEEYYFKILTLIKNNTGDKILLIKARCLNNLGNLCLTQDKNLEAKSYFLRSLELRKAANDLKGMALTLSNLGIANLNLGNYAHAESDLLQALAIKEKRGSKKSLAATLNQLGKLYGKLGLHKKSSEYLDRSKQIISKIGTLDQMVENLELRIDLLNNAVRHSELSDIYDHYLVLKDSLLNQQLTESLAEMQVKYETEQREQAIAILEREKELQQAELDVRQAWITTLITVVFLGLIIVILLYNRFRLEAQNKRKTETLMQEAQHRIKNNLQTLSSLFSLQTRTLSDENAILAIKSGESRINSMAVIHQKLNSSQKHTELNIREYLSDLITYLSQSYGYGDKSETIMIDVPDISLDVDMVLPLGLITNELVSNTFKYAFPDHKEPYLQVTLSLNERKKLHLTVKDNGPGLSELSKNSKGDSLGLQLVNTLVNQLKGEISVITDHGLKTIIQIPINNYLWKK